MKNVCHSGLPNAGHRPDVCVADGDGEADEGDGDGGEDDGGDDCDMRGGETSGEGGGRLGRTWWRRIVRLMAMIIRGINDDHH